MFFLMLIKVFFDVSPVLGGSGELVSRLITPITQIQGLGFRV